MNLDHIKHYELNVHSKESKWVLLGNEYVDDLATSVCLPYMLRMNQDSLLYKTRTLEWWKGDLKKKKKVSLWAPWALWQELAVDILQLFRWLFSPKADAG